MKAFFEINIKKESETKLVNRLAIFREISVTSIKMNLICDLSFVAALITVCTDLTIGQQIFDEYNIELFQNKTCETLGYNKYVRPRIESNVRSGQWWHSH